MAARKKGFTFESGMAELEALVDQISGGELSLEEELAGMEKRIEQIDLNTAEITAFEEKDYGV